MNLSCPNIITTKEALGELVEQAKRIGYLALDTEFIWERTYYPKLGLIQVGFSKEECFLIDVLAGLDLNPLADLLVNANIVKILHDAQQDLIILRQTTGAYPKNIFDTRYAAGFVGIRSTISLSDLVSTLCAVNLAKTETRTNWLRRPLSIPQIDYALDDVRYLPEIREKILARIKRHDREAWLLEDLEEYDNPNLYREKDPYEQYRQVKGAGKLHDDGLAVLRELAAWREKEARRRDRPKSWIIADEILIRIAVQKPRSLDNLLKIKGPSERFIRSNGGSLLTAIEKGLSLEDTEYPLLRNGRERNNSPKTLIDFGFAMVRGKSQGYGIDPGLMASRAEIKALVSDGSKANSDEHRILRGWRKKILGEQLKLLLSG